MTKIVVANRTGLASAPDGSNYRLARGRTLADARHPLVAAYPDMFSEYSIDLPYEESEEAVAGRPDAAGATDAEMAEARAAAEEYREQLAAIVEVLRAHDALPAEEAMSEPGWLARAIEASLTAAAPASGDASALEAPELPAARPRKRAPRRPAVSTAPAEGESADGEE